MGSSGCLSRYDVFKNLPQTTVVQFGFETEYLRSSHNSAPRKGKQVHHSPIGQYPLIVDFPSKVGITHLILFSCHRLKSITLENCPELQAIVVNSGTAPPSDSMPNLRRIRIMRCPKFAIYNLLYQVTRFYPQHDDNLYITYR